MSFIFNCINSNDISVKQRSENHNENERKKRRYYISQVTL